MNGIDRPQAVCRILGPHSFLLNILSTLFHCLVSSKSPEKSEAILSLFSRLLASSLWVFAVGCFSFYSSNSEFLKSHSFLSSIFTQSPWNMVSPVCVVILREFSFRIAFLLLSNSIHFSLHRHTATLDRPNCLTRCCPFLSPCLFTHSVAFGGMFASLSSTSMTCFSIISTSASDATSRI